MSDFDKIIKEKAEQAEYSYSLSAWRRFKRFSGMKTSALLYAVVSISLLAAGASAFFLLRDKNNVEIPETPQIESSSDEPEFVDTLNVTIPEDLSEDVENAVQKVPSSPKSKPQVEKTEITNVEIVDSVKQAEPEKVVVKRERPAKRIGRPALINIDTIKDNQPSEEQIRRGNSRIF